MDRMFDVGFRRVFSIRFLQVLFLCVFILFQRDLLESDSGKRSFIRKHVVGRCPNRPRQRTGGLGRVGRASERARGGGWQTGLLPVKVQPLLIGLEQSPQPALADGRERGLRAAQLLAQRVGVGEGGPLVAQEEDAVAQRWCPLVDQACEECISFGKADRRPLSSRRSPQAALKCSFRSDRVARD